MIDADGFTEVVWYKDGVKKVSYYKDVPCEPMWNDDGQQMIKSYTIWKGDGLPDNSGKMTVVATIAFGGMVLGVWILASIILGWISDLVR